MERVYSYRWRWRLESPPEALWPLVSNTNRFNRDSGLPVVTHLGAGAALGTQRLRFTRLGVPVEWDEAPFEWLAPRSFGVLRTYRSGPFATLRVHCTLEPEGSGTLLHYRVDATARGTLGRVVVPLQLGRLSPRSFERTFRRYDALLLGQAAADVGTPSSAVDGIRLAALTERLAQRVPAAQVQLLADTLRAGEELTLARLRPYALAVRWGLPRPAARDLCLAAAAAGLLDLQWDLLCPRCRGAKQTAASLGELGSTMHCDACRIDFRADLEQQVELTFRPNPALRRVTAGEYCIGSPQRQPHIVMQQRLEPGAARTLELALAPGTYILRTFATAAQGGSDGAAAVTVAEDGITAASATLDSAGWQPASVHLAPLCSLTLTNSTDTAQLVLLERTAWRDDALTAAELTRSARFRDLFARELLRPDASISVGALTVAFTDLRGSTALYRSLGDAPAFGRVQDHFDILRRTVEAEDGTLVKTMGDAVLAVFATPAAGLRAMVAAQHALTPLAADGLQLKAGLHCGPCIAITQNERLDYFGTTLNVAARLVGECGGGEIVLSADAAADPEVAETLPGLKCEECEVVLKGVEGVQQVWRVRAGTDQS